MENKYKLVLDNGLEFVGTCYGEPKKVIGELVFNTGVVGYQEITTDPTYMSQIVVMTYPLIGSYGINDDDNESKNIRVAGMIVKEYNDQISNFRATKTLSESLKEANVPLLSDIETRYLTNLIRDNKVKYAMICSCDYDTNLAIKELEDFLPNKNLVEMVSTKTKIVSRTRNPKYNIVCLDLGVKNSIVKALNSYLCNVTILPFDSSSEEILKHSPDGLLLSNGPGNPNDLPEVIGVVKSLIGKLPIYGLGLGHQIIALSYDAKVSKMNNYHVGSNHAVKNIITNKVEIVEQNHSYEVLKDSLNNIDLKISHINTLDNSVEGLIDDKNYVFTTQFIPSQLSNPSNTKDIYQQFLNNIDKFRGIK